MVDAAEYCRQIETYLCRKNAGHLIRIVGPAFEQVCGWAEQGVPLKVAFRGIDRCCERYYARGSKRRPLRIEFCEADILELFDAWRRAIGIPAVPEQQAEPSRRTGLASHLERVVARLNTLRDATGRSDTFHALVDAATGELERAIPDARHARGATRAAIIARLEQLDREIVEAAAREIDPAAADALRGEAEAELAPFGARIAPGARAAAVTAAWERLVRETVGLPVIAYD